MREAERKPFKHLLGTNFMERYGRESKLSVYWFNRANDLRGAAGAVWYAINCEINRIHDFLKMESGYSFAIATPSVFRMLCGLSLELLYKAIILATGGRPPKSHKLRQLAIQAKVIMDANDLDLLDILTDHIEWAGKYPVPKGERMNWDQHVELMNTALTDRVPGSLLNIRRPNNRLDWDGYGKLWSIGLSRYWKVRA